jgi:predicted RNase H-like HicB family nuclease
MKIRVKWQGNQWWAYFNDYPEAYFHTDTLEQMCNSIAVAWPRLKEIGRYGRN